MSLQSLFLRNLSKYGKKQKILRDLLIELISIEKVMINNFIKKFEIIELVTNLILKYHFILFLILISRSYCNTKKFQNNS